MRARALIETDELVHLRRVEVPNAAVGALGELGEAVPHGPVHGQEAVDVQDGPAYVGPPVALCRMQTMDARLVTPEAVVLQFDTAGLGSRFIGRMLDTVVQLALLFGFSFVFFAAFSG